MLLLHTNHNNLEIPINEIVVETFGFMKPCSSSMVASVAATNLKILASLLGPDVAATATSTTATIDTSRSHFHDDSLCPYVHLLSLSLLFTTHLTIALLECSVLVLLCRRFYRLRPIWSVSRIRVAIICVEVEGACIDVTWLEHKSISGEKIADVRVISYRQGRDFVKTITGTIPGYTPRPYRDMAGGKWG